MALNWRRLPAFIPLASIVACSPAVVQSASALPAATITTIVQTQPTVTVTSFVKVTETQGSSQLSRVFDRAQVEQGVLNVLSALPPSGYGLNGITNLKCPENQPVKAGTSFKCTLDIDGSSTSVVVVVKNSDGLYEVNPPS